MCEKYCLQNAISTKDSIKIDEEKCDNCNICTSVCPTGNLIPSYSVLEKQYNALSENNNISIVCDKCELNGDFRVNCFASLPWEYIAYASLENKISLYTKHCVKCEKQDLVKLFNQTLNKVSEFLGEELYKERVILINEGEIPTKEYSRRDLLKLWGEQSKRIATTVVPIDFDENDNPRIYRDLLIKKLKVINNEKELYNWPGIKVDTNKCWSCKTCEKLCPQNAISIEESEEGKGKFIHKFTRCTHCEICKTVCLDKAIELVNVSATVSENKTESIVKYLKCSVCNDPINDDDDGICVACRK